MFISWLSFAYNIIEFVEAMAEAYQNLEILKLTTYNIYSGNSVLSALCFPKLTSLSLSNFRLGHGSFLLKVIIFRGVSILDIICTYIILLRIF